MSAGTETGRYISSATGGGRYGLPYRPRITLFGSDYPAFLSV